MFVSFLLSCSCLLAGVQQVETNFVQVHPAQKSVADCTRSSGQVRAVVLIHGLRLHQFMTEGVHEPVFVSWQKSDSVLARALARDSDVYGFAYGQNRSVADVPTAPGLGAGIQRLKKLGYTEIVLIGTSAGGLIARQFVEDNPQSGVSKVIQLCTPNGGSSWGKLRFGIPKDQSSFIESLTPEKRLEDMKNRAHRKVPGQVEFVCIVGTGGDDGDGVVTLRGQWPEDLQRQGICAVPLVTMHLQATQTQANVEVIAGVVRKEHPRWDTNQVALARAQLFGGEDDAYQRTIESRAGKAQKETDIQAMIECAYALYPLEFDAKLKEPRYLALLNRAADMILSARDPAAAQHFLELAGPLLAGLAETKTEQLTRLVVGRPIQKAMRDEAERVRGPVKKLGPDLVDPEVKARGPLDKELAEMIGRAVLMGCRPATGFAADHLEVVDYKWSFPKKQRATLHVKIRWPGTVSRRYESEIDLTFQADNNSTEVLSLEYRDDCLFPAPQSPAQLRDVINDLLRRSH